jgi:hypothetical protein
MAPIYSYSMFHHHHFSSILGLEYVDQTLGISVLITITLHQKVFAQTPSSAKADQIGRQTFNWNREI